VFEKLGQLIVRRSKTVLIVYAITILAAGGIGSMAFGKLDSGGYSDLSSESAKAARYITDTFKVQDPVAILVVDAGSRSVDDPNVISEATSLEREVAATKGISRTLS
jgi:RND superfamily putative drug exporter